MNEQPRTWTGNKLLNIVLRSGFVRERCFEWHEWYCEDNRFRLTFTNRFLPQMTEVAIIEEKKDNKFVSWEEFARPEDLANYLEILKVLNR